MVLGLQVVIGPLFSGKRNGGPDLTNLQEAPGGAKMLHLPHLRQATGIWIVPGCMVYDFHYLHSNETLTNKSRSTKKSAPPSRSQVYQGLRFL